MQKLTISLQINKDGYLIGPYFQHSDSDIDVEVDEDLYAKLSSFPGGFNWRYVNGEWKLEELLSDEILRSRREYECFIYINRGGPWYDLLTEQQKQELKEWYQAWLNVTDTKVIPVKPSWLK